MMEHIILGIIQGIAEWLPVSSEGLLVLANTVLFDRTDNIQALIQQALHLHLGTWLAAVIYFRKDLAELAKTLFQNRSRDKDTEKILHFLILSTLISGILGLGLLKTLSKFSQQLNITSQYVIIGVGILLLITAFLEINAGKSKQGLGIKEPKDLKIIDGVILGIVQGCAALPGLSRSGLTVSALLLRKFNKIHALKLSFLMSIPIVLAGNIVLQVSHFTFDRAAWVGVFFAFLFGLITIHLLLKLAQKVNFGYFVLVFGILTILSAFI